MMTLVRSADLYQNAKRPGGLVLRAACVLEFEFVDDDVGVLAFLSLSIQR
jgi:hypothetical protein